MNAFQQVVQFNVEVLGITARPLTYPIGAEVDHALKCLDEERNEFANAFQSGDFIGCVDANIDVIYFAIGNLHKMGLTAEQMEQIFTVVHNKNMTKKAGQVESRATEGAVDAVKGEGWVGPEAEIGAILDQVPVATFVPPVGEAVQSEQSTTVIDNPENDPETLRKRAAETEGAQS